MKEPQNRKIDDLDIIVSAWGARRAWKNQIKFGKVFGPSLRDIGAALGEKQEGTSIFDSNIGFEKIGEAIANLFSNVSEEESEDILMECFTNVRVNNQEITNETFDVIFSGRLATVYKIIGFVMEVNYGSFLGKSGIGKLLKKKQTV